jgi:hypothetical protein
MSAFMRRDTPPRGPTGATIAVNAGSPYEVIAYSFGEGRERQETEIGLPELTALALIRTEDEPWIRDAERERRDLICVLDPAEPESQIGAFTYMGRISGFRELNDGRLAAEFTSIGPITPHFLRR